MERRKFIQLLGLTSLGICTGARLLASNSFAASSSYIVNIEEPKIHNRHGLFDLHSTRNHQGIYVQRDIMARDGLGIASPNRMTTVKIKDDKLNVFGLLHKTEFTCESNNLTCLHLTADHKKSLSIQSASMIFSEHQILKVGKVFLEKNQGIIISSNQNIELVSSTNQSVFIYQLPA